MTLVLVRNDEIQLKDAPTAFLGSPLCAWCPHSMNNQDDCEDQCSKAALALGRRNPQRYFFVDTLTAITWRLTK